MHNLFRVAVIVLVFVPLASGCQTGMPRWDWWRSAQTGPPPGAMVAENNAPKYPQLPSSSVTPANMTASNGTTNPFPPGTSAPTTGSPGTETSTASTGSPGSYPSTGVGGGYPSTAGSYAPQTGSYDANDYNPYANAAQPAAHVASNPNQYGAPAGGYNSAANTGAYPSTGNYPATSSPTYPSTDGGYNAPPSYGAPAAGGAGNYGAGAADAGGYGTGSRYDTPVGDRYGAGGSTPSETNYGAPAGNTYPATGAESPASYNNYGPPNNNYPTTPSSGGAYQGSDATSPTGATNYASISGASNDRYSSTIPNNTSGGPVATTADLRNRTAPTNVPYYDNAVTPASGGSYLPAGTKLLEGAMPTSPPAGETPTAPYGSYGTPGKMG